MNGFYISSLANISSAAALRIELPVTLGQAVFHSSCAIGRYSYMRSGTVNCASSIGRFCSLGPDIRIGDGNHPTTFLSTHPFQYGAAGGFSGWKEFDQFKAAIKLPPEIRRSAPVIGHDVWIGAGAMIQMGVRIGSGAVIAGGSIVTKDVPPYAIVAGVPAKLLRMRFNDDTVQELLRLQWWNYTLPSLQGLDFQDVERSISELNRRIEAGQMQTASVERVEVTRNGIERLDPA